MIRWTFPKLEKFAPRLAEKWATRLFFRPIRFPYPEYEKPYLEKADKFVFEINSKKVTGYSYGEGTPILFVHGWSGRATQFWKFTDLFTQYGFRVITFDAPGHGYSSGNRTNVIEFSEIVTELANNFKAKTVVGHSLGGVASLLAVSRGLPVKNVMLINSPSLADQLLGEFLSKINATEISGRGVLKYIESNTQKPLEEFMSLHLLKDIEGINLQMIHDETDREVPIVHAETLQDEYPEARLVKTNGLGHSRILSDDRVISETLAFAYKG